MATDEPRDKNTMYLVTPHKIQQGMILINLRL